VLADNQIDSEQMAAMPTGAQIRAARALLGISARELARRARVSPRTVTSAEGVDGAPPVQVRSLELIRAALEAAGVEFTRNNGVGVRRRR
jgi:transcriptional regulator with XRE-family HTH domain